MYVPPLIATLLLAGCFAISTRIEPWYQDWRGSRRTNVLSMLIGDSRRLFANHFFAKADAYFHGGYYPSIFDHAKPETKSHMEESTDQPHAEESEECQHEGPCDHGEEHEAEFLDAPQDWIEAFGRNFFPSEHSHLKSSGDFREILPWLRLTAELDPQKVETYTVAAFTLRTRLNKPKEAEQFLREGLRANPDSYEILFEMGRLRDEAEHDSAGARNLMELALKKWRQGATADLKPDEFSGAQILGMLASIEEKERRFEQALAYLRMLKEISPYKDQIDRRIQEVQEMKAKP